MREIASSGRFDMCFLQVLTGETPFRGIRQSALAFHVFRGKRPDKPDTAEAIGFSDSLWDFTQRCWDGDMKSRPEVREVVTHLKEAAADWDGLMPPHVQSKDVSDFEEMSDSKEHSESNLLVLPSYYRTTVQAQPFNRLQVLFRRAPPNRKPPLNYPSLRAHNTLWLVNHHGRAHHPL